MFGHDTAYWSNVGPIHNERPMLMNCCSGDFLNNPWPVFPSPPAPWDEFSGRQGGSGRRVMQGFGGPMGVASPPPPGPPWQFGEGFGQGDGQGQGFGALLPTGTIELGPSTMDLISKTRNDIVRSADNVSNEVAAAVKMMGLGILVAGVAVGVGLMLKK